MVPKVIHHIVGPTLNEVVKYCLASWRCLRKESFLIKIWNDTSIEAFLHENFPESLSAFLNARNHAEAGDIARYLIIYKEGGYYVDWDVQLLDKKAFLHLGNAHPHGYLVRDSFNNTLASEFFCAMPREPYLKNLSHDIIEIYNKGKRSTLTTPFFTGPYRMKESLSKHPKTKLHIVEVEDVFAYNYREIRQMLPKQMHQPMIHYWLHSWLKKS